MVSKFKPYYFISKKNKIIILAITTGSPCVYYIRAYYHVVAQNLKTLGIYNFFPSPLPSYTVNTSRQ